MPQFASEYVGGPADGLPLVTVRAPQHKETVVWTDAGRTQHLYVFRCEGFRAPAWRYAGVLNAHGSTK